MLTMSYPMTIRHETDGHYHVYVRDLPEVITSGKTLAKARAMAADAVAVAVHGRMEDEMDLPAPSRPRRGEVVVGLPAQLAAKAIVFRAWRASGITKVEFARLLGVQEAEARRILNPRHGTKLERLEEAASALGVRLLVASDAA
ncbi:MAG TPA: type II toxin-antitoxin system HicB family antitoxin [Xanthobacteraceae bacterium]